jgi:hypothetical protein
MTPREAKELSLKVWRYLTEHPEIKHKKNLPDFLWKRIRHLRHACPLCEINYIAFCCPMCPLKSCDDDDSLFDRWSNSELYASALKEDAETIHRAQGIVDIIQAWEPEEEG